MTAFGWFQLLVDVAFCFFILVLLVGRSWRRGSGGANDQEAYREMISTLSALIREMKEGTAEMEQRMETRRAEIEQAVAAADVRLEHLEAAMLKSGPLAAKSPAPGATASPVAPPSARTPASPAVVKLAGDPGAVPAVAGEIPDMDDDERRERYRQALDLARKGWSVLEIARHTRLPRGEIELLVRTKGQAG